MKTHFHTFDAFRFLAFFKVFLYHIPVFTFPAFNFLREGGETGVLFFFVLSGFLITYKILEEKSRAGQLNLSHFYIRRILRIWPLYYLMVLFAFVTPYLLNLLSLPSSAEGYTPNWWMTLAFLENYKMLETSSHPNVSPLSVMWTLCVEEHFYLIWGVAFYYLNLNRTLVFLLSTIALSLAAHCLFTVNRIPPMDILTNLGYFAFGALPAYGVIHHKGWLNAVVNRMPRWCKYLFVFAGVGYVLLSANVAFAGKVYVEPLVLGIIFSGILCLTVTKDSFLKVSDQNVLTKLGLYTYGLYMYHTIVINLLVKLFARFALDLGNPLNVFYLVTGSLLLTIGISFLSFHLFEKQFLKMKVFFSEPSALPSRN